MKVLLMIGLLLSPSLVLAERHRRSSNDVYVGGYTRNNGTYVQPHYRSAPNANRWDNYGYTPSQPQYNPSYNTPRNSNWYQPNPGRFNDSNPYNDAPGSGR